MSDPICHCGNTMQTNPTKTAPECSAMRAWDWYTGKVLAACKEIMIPQVCLRSQLESRGHSEVCKFRQSGTMWTSQPGCSHKNNYHRETRIGPASERPSPKFSVLGDSTWSLILHFLSLVYIYSRTEFTPFSPKWIKISVYTHLFKQYMLWEFVYIVEGKFVIPLWAFFPCMLFFQLYL